MFRTPWITPRELYASGGSLLVVSIRATLVKKSLQNNRKLHSYYLYSASKTFRASQTCTQILRRNPKYLHCDRSVRKEWCMTAILSLQPCVVKLQARYYTQSPISWVNLTHSSYFAISFPIILYRHIGNFGCGTKITSSSTSSFIVVPHNTNYGKFLPRDAMHSAAYAVVRGLSVRPSVCHIRVLYRNEETFSQTCFHRLVGTQF